jgi:hypothetical protein
VVVIKFYGPEKYSKYLPGI